jgi:hypothetical protein
VILNKENQAMKWEYKTDFIQTMTASDLTKELNKYGKDRWELVSVLSQGTSLLAFFKKPNLDEYSAAKKPAEKATSNKNV